MEKTKILAKAYNSFIIAKSPKLSSKELTDLKQSHTKVNKGIKYVVYPSVNWENELRPYLPPNFDFSLSPKHDGMPRRFALNKPLVGKTSDRIYGEPVWDTVIFFETQSATPSTIENFRLKPPALGEKMPIVLIDAIPELIDEQKWRMLASRQPSP